VLWLDAADIDLPRLHRLDRDLPGDFFGRVARRLDADARAALAVYKDGSSLGIAGLSILVPPISILVLAAMALLLVRGRRRDDEKYAGLRSLR
jgi:hypothetical protein